MDRSARASMKNAANCVNQCELQDTLIIDTSNAHGGSVYENPEPRPVEGRLFGKSTNSPRWDRPIPGVSDGSSRFDARPSQSSMDPELDASEVGVLSLSAPSLSGMGRSFRWWLGRVRFPPLSRACFTRPQLGRDDPLNLSILLRGGKENNDDSLSKGD